MGICNRFVMALPVLATLIILAKSSSASAAYPPLDLPAFSLLELQKPSAITLKAVGQAISRLGMLAVTGVEDVTHPALSSFVSCALRGDLNLRQVKLKDGALRNTLATATNSGVPEPLTANTSRNCPDFALAANKLRTAVQATGNAYAAVLDNLLYGSSACTPPSTCFTRAVQEAESLEHFHLFEPSTSRSADHMLAMHSDIGLFLVMTPAELFGRTAATFAADEVYDQAVQRSGDLVVQLADGSIVTPVLPEGALLVMNGEGLMRWMRPPAADSVLPYSPMHEVLSSDLGGGVRAWFGRMFMPPNDAKLQVADLDDEYDDGDGDDDVTGEVFGADMAPLTRDVTFAEYRRRTYELFNRGEGALASTAGCSPTRRLLVDESSCGANEVYCWMSCMTITPNISCSKSDILCANMKNTSLLWPRDYTSPATNKPTHCFDCGLTCPAAKPPTSTSSFCNTALGPTTMWMTGFQFAAGHHSDPCVVFLFPEWVLDTKGKLAGACIGTFFAGVLVGLLGWLRVRIKDMCAAKGLWDPDYRPRWRPWLAEGGIVTIIAVQVCFAYWLMLIAMTYQAELFIMVVLGLAFGHLFFRPRPRQACKPSANGKMIESKASGSSGSGEEVIPCCVV